jgi:hypothetical protein
VREVACMFGGSSGFYSESAEFYEMVFLKSRNFIF